MHFYYFKEDQIPTVYQNVAIFHVSLGENKMLHFTHHLE